MNELKVQTAPRKSRKAVVLFVDDQEEILSSLRRALRSEPYEIHTTRSPREAARMIEEGKIDILVTDERMPEMRGTDLLEIARKTSPDTTRVILTGYPGSSTIDYGLAESVDWLISKPWNDDALRLTLRQLLMDRKSRKKGETTRKNLPVPRSGPGEYFEIRDRDFAEFCERSPVPIHFIAADGTILWANQAALELMATPREAYVGRPASDFLVDPATAERILQRLFKRVEVRRYETRLRCGDGKTRDVLVDADVCWEGGKFKYARVLTSDITPQKMTKEGLETKVHERTRELRAANQELLREIAERARAEETLRLSEERFRLLVDGVTDYAIFMLDPEGIVVSWNIGAERINGYTADQILGRHFSIFYLPEDVAAGKPQRLLRAASEEGRAEDEGWRLRRDGSRFWTHGVITPIRDGEGNLRGFSKVTRDMTELRKAEEERARLQAQMLQGQKLQAIGQLSAGIAHEINNPVGYILSNLTTMGEYCRDLSQILRAALAGGDEKAVRAEVERLRKELNPDFILEDFGKAIQESRQGAERIRDIVKSLREFSHMDEGAVKPTDLNKCLDDALRICWNEIKYKAEVKKEYGPLPPVSCYPQRLGQVFVNLLVNAAQAIEKKGTISLRTSVEDGRAVIRIRDTGAGIPPENLKRLFEPFFTTKPVGTGTGLGLHVVYKIITAHGGKIEVQSQAGQGTEFTIRLPVSGPGGAKS